MALTAHERAVSVFVDNALCLAAENIRQKNLSGVIITGLVYPETVSVIAEQKPCVWLNFHGPGIQLDTVGQDDWAAVGEVISFLKTNGHRKIGYFCEPPMASYSLSRFAGYVGALAREGLEYDPAWSVNIWEDTGDNAMMRVESAVNAGVRAWVCAHDGLGYKLIQNLNRLGFCVPDDVSVCGFDHLHTVSGPKPLTTVDWPLEDMAAAAVEMLIRRINEPVRAAAQMLFAGSLVEGATVGSFSS